MSSSGSKRSRTDSGPHRAESKEQAANTENGATHAANGINTPSPAAVPRPIAPAASAASSSSPAPRTCLLVIDVQNDFCTGSLKAPDALSVIPVVNSLRMGYSWDLIVYTQDAHPPNHVSFYINHASNPDAKLFEPLTLPNGSKQVMWPVHCVQGSWGQQLHRDLVTHPTEDVIVEKGTVVDQESELQPTNTIFLICSIYSRLLTPTHFLPFICVFFLCLLFFSPPRYYSAFICTDGIHQTELSRVLRSHGIERVVTCGLVYEYCVGNSAIDSAKEGFETFVVVDAVRGLKAEPMAHMKKAMEDAGVTLINQIANMEEHGFTCNPPAKNRPIFTTSAPHSSSPSSAQLAASSLDGASSWPSRPRVLLGLSGSVATIKAPDLIKLLLTWCDVRVITTGKSVHFASVTLLKQLGVQVYQDEDEWDSSNPWTRGMSVLHVELRKWADMMIVAPLSANTLAKIANGLCDNLLVSCDSQQHTLPVCNVSRSVAMPLFTYIPVFLSFMCFSFVDYHHSLLGFLSCSFSSLSRDEHINVEFPFHK